LMELTGKSEEDVVIALHDAENDADGAVMILLEGGDEQQGEWREQGGKRKKKSNTSALKDSNHTNEDQFENRPKDRGDREEREGGADRGDAPPRRGGRRNGGPPPRLARGRGRDRGNVGDRENRDRSNTEDWDNDRGDDKRDRSGADRGRPRGKGGFGVKRGGGGGRGRFSNSNDRDGNRSYNRVPRFEKMNNSQHIDGPEIDTWTNETAETKTVNKDTDWNNWNDTWVNEEDQWTGTLDETKVFTPSTMKIPEPEPVISEPPSSLGQRLDVGSLFIESAKFSKAPDYSKPSGDAYITQFNQAATESIKNTIGIGSSTRGPQSMNSLSMSQQSATDSLGLSSLAQSTSPPGVGVLPSLTQPGSQSSITQMSQISQSVSQAMSQIGGMGSQNLPAQSRIPSVQQQQQQNNMGAPVNLSSSLQQRPKPQRSKLPPPSKIPASAVEMPGHISRNPQLDLQFGIDFGSESNTSFGFGADDDASVVTSTYVTTSNGTPSVISNHMNQAQTVSKAGVDTTRVSGLMSSPNTGSTNVPSPIELQQSNRSTSVFHNSVYTTSPPKNDSQSLDRDQNKMGAPDSIAFPSSQLERKSPMMSQRVNQPNQNLNTGSLAQSKNEGTSNFSSTNGYSSSSYPSHQKNPNLSHNQSTYNHSSSSQPPQSSPFPGQYPASQSAFPSSGQSQFGSNHGSSQFPPPSSQPPQFNNAQNQYSAGQNQYSSGSSSHPPMPHGNHQSQYSSGPPNNYSSGGQNQFSGYQNSSSSSFPSHPPSSNYTSSNQSGGPSSSLYPATTQSGGGSSYTAQSNSYQSPSAGSYNTRDNPPGSGSSTHSSTGVNFPTPPQGLSLKPSTSQTNTNYNSQGFSGNATTLQPSSLANKLGESLSKMTLKETASLDTHQSSQYDHSSTSTASVSASLSLPSTTTAASLSSGTSTISSTSTAASVTSTSRIASMPSTSKAPPNLPPGVPLMGQYIMNQNAMPPFYSVPPVYGYEDMQLLQQRMPLQTGSYYDMSAFPAPPGSTLPTGRDQQPPLPNVPFTGTSADSTKVPRVDAQSPNSSSQPQNAHSAAQPFLNYYGFYYPSMFPGTAAGLQYPMFPMPPVTNAAAHAGTTATTQFQKSYASHMYSTKGYDELNQAQDFSKTGYGSSPNPGKAAGTRSGTSDMTPNAYNKPHTQPFDKQGFHGGTPPPYSLPLASATQSGPMGGPTNPYGAPFLPVMAAHQAHSPMIHHPIQQDSGSSSARGLNPAVSQSKAGGGKSYGGAPYWNN
ncbi:ubiquitin-associated protein 2, partial [Elysia marginata]